MTGAITAFAAAQVFDGTDLLEDRAVLVADGLVQEVVPSNVVLAHAQEVRLGEGILAPGFVDLQVNGGGGVMFNDAPSRDTLRTMAEAHARLGTTTLVPTLITDRPEITEAAVDAVAGADVPGVIGLHLEGPHLAPAKKGAHDADLIRAMTLSDLEFLLESAARLPILKVTLAPESVSVQQIAALAEAGVIVSLGHSACDYQVARQAGVAGARCVTHLFNAMSGLDHREPGLVGAALAWGGFSAGLIADLVHVHGDVIRLALAAKQGPGQIFLVTDAMAVAGTDLNNFRLNGRAIHRSGGRLTLVDGTLAGADLDLPTALRNLAQLGVPLERALAMATAIPADVVGAKRAGRLAPGMPADMVYLTPALDLVQAWRGGQKIA